MYVIKAEDDADTTVAYRIGGEYIPVIHIDIVDSIYKELSELVGLDATLKIYLRFKGQQVSFPVRLYNPQMIQQSVIKEYDGTNIAELAQKYDYSEKTIRRMIRDSVEDTEDE